MTINQLFQEFRKDLSDTERLQIRDKLLKELGFLTADQLRKSSRAYRLNAEDKKDVRQEIYILFLSCTEECILQNLDDFEHTFILCIQRHLRRMFSYKKKEENSGLISIDHNIEEKEEDKFEDYFAILKRVARKPKEVEAVEYIFEHRFLDRNFTLSEIAKVKGLSLNKIFKLERRMRELLRKKWEKDNVA